MKIKSVVKSKLMWLGAVVGFVYPYLDQITQAVADSTLPTEVKGGLGTLLGLAIWVARKNSDSIVTLTGKPGRGSKGIAN